MKKRITAIVCAAVMLVPALCANADYKESDLKTAVNSAVKWKDSNDSPFYDIGSNSADIYITALKRLGKSYDYTSYLSGMDGIAAGYGSEHNASDMQRGALAVIASGGDAQNVGGRDLIADSTYYRDASSPLDKEGANGYSWALITLDSNDYETPDWAIKNRDKIIAGVLSHQNTDGSFDGSVYSTASAIAALAPYCETSGAYTITQNQTGWTYDLSPKDAVNNALEYLSDTQEKDGDWGDSISTAMVVIALDAMKIDADGDSRFSARGGTALEGLMSFRNNDGGFAYDSKKSDGESTSYALLAMTSHLRKLQDKSMVFKLNTDDSVSLATPAPTSSATTSPSNSSGSSSSSSSKTGSSSGTSSSSSSSKSTATAKPSSTATAKPTTKPSNTMIPTKTAQPKASASPDASPKPSPLITPKPTRRPDLVGPVLMAGPMPSLEPYDIQSGGQASSKTNSFPIAAVIGGVAAILVLAALGIALALISKNKKSGSTGGGIFPIFNHASDKKAEPYKAKTHRKTELHRRYESRERFKQRQKFRKKR